MLQVLSWLPPHILCDGNTTLVFTWVSSRAWSLAVSVPGWALVSGYLVERLLAGLNAAFRLEMQVSFHNYVQMELEGISRVRRCLGQKCISKFCWKVTALFSLLAKPQLSSPLWVDRLAAKSSLRPWAEEMSFSLLCRKQLRVWLLTSLLAVYCVCLINICLSIPARMWPFHCFRAKERASPHPKGGQCSQLLLGCWDSGVVLREAWPPCGSVGKCLGPFRGTA